MGNNQVSYKAFRERTARDWRILGHSSSRGNVLGRQHRFLAGSFPFPGFEASKRVDTFLGFATLLDPRRFRPGARYAAVSLTSQQLECREGVSRKLSGTAGNSSANRRHHSGGR